MKPAFSHFRSTSLSAGMWSSIHAWLMLSKQPRMSPSRTHCALLLRASTRKHWLIASAVERSVENHRSWDRLLSPRLGAAQAGIAPAWRGLGDGDFQRSQLPVGLRDIDPPQRSWLIAAPFQRVDGLVSDGVLQIAAVHSRRVLALIVRHPFHSQRSAMERVGQQPLQGFHLAVTAFLCCLDDTRLQPPDLVLASRTRRPVPIAPQGRRLHTWIAPHSFAFPPSKIL